MLIRSALALTIAICFLSASEAWGQASLVTVDYHLQGGSINATTHEGGGYDERDRVTSQTRATVANEKIVGHSTGLAIGTVYATADAVFRSLGVSATGSTEASYGAGASNEAYASAEIIDFLTFSSTEGSLIDPIRVRGSYILKGSVSGTANGALPDAMGWYVHAETTASVSAYGTGLMVDSYGQVATGYRTVDYSLREFDEPFYENVVYPAPTVIEFDFEAIPWQFTEMKIGLTAYSLQRNYHRNPTDDGSGDATGNVDFSHTLTWNGISSVTYVATGEPVPGLTITSISGFDYNTMVPEPTAICLCLMGLVALPIRRRLA